MAGTACWTRLFVSLLIVEAEIARFSRTEASRTYKYVNIGKRGPKSRLGIVKNGA